MKQKIEEKVIIPEGVNCEYKEGTFYCRSDSLESSKKIIIPEVSLEIKNNEVILSCNKANKGKRKVIISFKKHIENLINGMNEKYIYKIEACNVHFPMSLKIEGNKLLINNFLGEKVARVAKILAGVDAQLKGTSITLTSHNKEAAGQTASNMEKATMVRNRDRRVFQDGLFITEKPGDKK